MKAFYNVFRLKSTLRRSATVHELAKKETLLTPWGEHNRTQTHIESYPRPQLVRKDWINLNGQWSYFIASHTSYNRPEHFVADGEICVPFPIESHLSGVQKALNPDETLWYKRHFKINHLTEVAILHFAAVDWQAKVWLNGIEIGLHKGGYCPFSFEVQHALVLGDNEIIVAVNDPTDAGLQERGKQSLHPQGLFYTAVSGIWQTVWLEQLNDCSIKKLHFNTNIYKGQVKLGGRLYGQSPINVNIKVYDEQQCLVQQHIECEQDTFEIEFQLTHIKYWHPDTPHLYDVEITICDRLGTTLDECKSYFAMRDISIVEREGHPLIALNGEPIFQLGVLDQGYWPDGLYTPATDEAFIADIVSMKELGFNMLRKHIKVEDARFYYHCDRLGMLVWQDMINGGRAWNVVQEAVLPNLFPNWFRKDNTKRSYKRTGRYEQQNRQQFLAELTEMIEHLKHFPSIVVWCPFNEGWGQFDAKAVTDYILTLDATRLIDHASGWFDQKAGHMRSIHTYFRPLYKPKRTYGRVPVLSEFGGYNLQINEHTEEGHKETGYKKCRTKEELQVQYSKLMEQLQRQIKDGLSASVYTQLSDVEGEVNGILTYDRKVMKLNKEMTKAKHEELYKQFDQRWRNKSSKVLNKG